jgi:hypothetical protein
MVLPSGAAAFTRHAEAALAAGAVLDDDRLLEGGAQVLGDEPGGRIARAAGREREHDADGLTRRLGEACGSRGQHHGGRQGSRQVSVRDRIMVKGMRLPRAFRASRSG